MTVSNWTQADTDRAQRIWSEYERQHDLSGQEGRTAGIDPISGRVWFGDSLQETVERRDADGSDAPLFFVRIGSETYYRKAGATQLRPHVDAQFIGRVISLLAGNRHVEEDVYLVDFPFDGQTLRVQATFVGGDEILIGTRMLRDYRLQIDFPAGTVAIVKA